MAAKASAEVPSPWYTAFPEPVTKVRQIERKEVLDMLALGEQSTDGIDFVLVDVRRTDFEVIIGI